LTGTGVPRVLRNLHPDHAHIQPPNAKKGREATTAEIPVGNGGRRKTRSRYKAPNIVARTKQKKVPPTTGVRRTRVLFAPVAVL